MNAEVGERQSVRRPRCFTLLTRSLTDFDGLLPCCQVTKENLVLAIEGIVNQISEAKGIPPAKLNDAFVLLGGSLPIDSLDLAQVVLELQTLTGLDPFEGGFIEFQTVGQLAELFMQ